MKKAFWIPATLFFMVLARHALAFYVDGSGTVPDALSGFVVPSGETSRGNVLAFSGGETWTLPVDASAHPVVSFVAKGSGVLAIEGASSVVIDSSEWRRHVIAVDGLSSLSFSATGEFKLDDFYLGRQLTNSLLNADDVLSCQGQEDGVLSAMADGGSIGMWESVKDFYGNDWTSDANGLKARISTSYAGLTNVCHMVAPLAAPLSDNIVVSFEVQKQRRLYNRPDRLFVAVSTNDCIAFSEWQSAAIALCEPFLVSFDDETDYSAGDWVPCSYGLEIKGLQGIPSVEIGFLTVAGRSGENVCIRNVSVTYMTRVTATAAGIEAGDGTGIIENPRYGLDGHARVNVNSTSDATGIDISVTHTRTHFGTRTYTFGPSSGPVPFWISPDEFDRDWGHVLEAGETNEFTVVTSYRSSQGLDTSHSPETDVFSFVVGGLGSVWINEIDAGNGKLELAGPPDRQITGWSLRKKGDENPLLTELSGTFGGAERGMAFLVLEHLAALSTLSAPVELELVNAAGIVEATTCEIDFSTKKIWAATGRLPYIADGTKGDWTGVSAGFSAMVNEDEASATFGHMNENVEQGADLPVRLAVEFRSLNQNNLLVQSFNPGFTGNPDLSLSFSILDENPLQERIAVITNELGDVVGEVTNTWLLAESVPDEPEGMATATTNVWYRYTAFLENLIPGTNTSSAIPMSRVTTLATAFGFYGETEIEGGALRLDDLDDTKVTTNVVRFLMRPSVGTETFGTDFRNRWNLSKDDGSVGEWVYQNSGGADGASDGFARAGISTSWSGSAARMQTGGTMSRRLGNGVRSYLKFSTTVKNTMAPSDSRKDVLSAILRDAISRDAVVSLTNANNRQPLYPQNTWVRFDQFARIPDEAPESFVFEIAAVAGRSGVNLDFDDLYVSFQDWAGVTDCVLTPAVPQAGKALKAEYTLASGDGGASNVVVSLVASLTRNGTTTVSTNEVFDIDWLEGSTSLAVENVLMKSGLADTFLEQDVFRFYFQTDYDTDNGAQQPEYQRDQSYYPGNATGSIEDGTWVAVGGNGPAAFDNQLGGTAWGVQEVWVNEINQTFVELCGMTNADITAWSLSVYSDAGAYQSSLSVTNKWEWSNTEENPGYGFYCFSNLNLLRAGALVVKDAEQRVRYAVSYGCSLPGYEQLGTDTVTVSGNTSLAATEYGNPANKAFENWESQSSSQDARNEDEDLVNKGPVSPLFTATAQSATNIVLFATASDMDKPLSYSIDGGCTWQTNELDVVGCTWNVGELDFNTRYEWTLRTKDAAGKESEETATVARYTLLDSFTATAEGAATDTITITATVPGLGNGQTAWWVDDTSVTNTEVSQIYSGEDWGPNSPHSFTLNACNGDGTTCATPVPVSGYTLAAVPGAALSVSNEANVVRLRLVEDADYANGNPDSTEYAVKATLYYKGQSASQSRYWTAGGDKPAWHTLADWPDVFAAKGWADDITPTNIVFQLVARNGNGTIKEEAGGPAAETHFELSIEPAGDAEQQYGNGLVELSALITNPWTNETAVALWYVVGNATNAATIAQASAAYGAAGLSAVETWKSGTNTVTVLWNAGQDLGAADVENVSFVWTAVTENSAPVDSTQAQGCDVYLARPAVSSVTAPASPAKKAAALPFTVVFDEPVSNLTAAAFTVANGSVSSIAPVDAANGFASRFTVAIAPSDQAAASLEVAITGITANAAADDWGNLSQKWTGNAAVTYDGKAPTVALKTKPATIAQASSNSFTATADDANKAQGLTLSWKLDNGSWTALSEQKSGFSWTFTVGTPADGQHKVSVKSKDKAGNESAVTEYAWTVDSTKPTVEIAAKPADPTGEGDFAIAIEATDANADKGFAFAWRVQCGGACVAEGSAPAGTAGPYTASGSGLEAGTYTFTATATDAAGNVSAAATHTWTVDGTKPTCTITRPAALVKGNNATFTIVFSEAVTGFVVGDIVADNCTLSNFSGSGTTNTVKATATSGATTIGISVPAHVCEDAQGNGNEAGALVTCTVDNTAPAIANLSASPARAKTGASVTVFFDVTEANGIQSVTVGSQAATKGAEAGINTRYSKTVAAGTAALSVTATDKAGNSTTKSFSNWVVIDNTAPVVTWTGLPTGETNATAVTAELTGVTDDDPNVRLAWSLDGGAEAEDWAVVGKTLLFNDLTTGEHTFTVRAWDTAGNTNTTSYTWTNVSNAADTTVNVSTAQKDGDSAVFTVVWDDATRVFTADSFALRVNNAETGTTVVTPVDANTATVTVPLTSYTEGAYVELTVPAGSLGNRMESTAKVAGFTPAAEPTLTYVGRSLTEPDILTWELRNATGSKTLANFSVFDPNPEAGDVSTDLSSIDDVSTKNGVTTIRVRDGGRAAVSDTVMTATDSSVKNWMADAFVNYRLVYNDNNGTVLTNVGPAEVNLALPAYGGSMVLNGSTNIWNQFNTAWNTGSFADGTMQTDFQGALGGTTQPRGTDIGYMTTGYADFGGLGYRSLYGRRKDVLGSVKTSDDKWLWESEEPVVIRSVQWMCAPANASVSEVWGITSAQLDVKSRNGVTLYTTNVSWTATQAKTKGFLYRIDIPEHVATNAARVLLSNIKSTKQTSVGGQNVYHIMLSEFAMMGAPASIACERPVPEITLTEAVKSEPGDLLFHVEYPQGGCGIDLSKASASGVAGTAAFTAENVTDTGCDLRVGGLTGAGDLTLTLAEDFERTPDGKSSVEAVWTGAVDCELPTLAFDAPVAANGLCTFTFATSELATGIGTNGMTLVTTGGVQAELASLERDGVNYTVVVRASGWQAGDKLKLRVAVTLTDLAGNTNAVDVTSNAVRLTDPTTDAVPSVTVTAGAGGTVSPAGTVAATNGTLKVTATPNAGYTFTKWTVGGMQKSTSVTASLTGLADGAQVQAVFTKEGTVNLKAAVNNSNYGTASWTSKSVSKGSNQSVTFTAKPGYYVSQVKEGSTVKVTTSNYPTSYTYSIDNVTANKTITGVFEALPTYTVSIHEKWKNAEGAVTNTVDSSASVNYNADWSRTFTATAGYAIESVSAGNASKPAAAGASAYTVQLRGVIAATTVEVVYMPVLEEEEPEEFTLTDLSWTSLDMEEGTLAFAATLEGEAPDALTLVYRTALGSSAQKAPGCGVEWSAGGGVLTLPDGWDDDVGFFAIGLEW